MSKKELPASLKEAQPDAVEDGTPEQRAAWRAWVRAIEDYLGHPICGLQRVKERHTDGQRLPPKPWPCPNRPTPGHPSGRCYLHGGRSAIGPQNGNWRHGRDSILAELLPERMQASFMASLADRDNLLDMSTSIATADAFEVQILDQLRQGDPVGRIQTALEVLDDLTVAMANGNSDALTDLMTRLRETLEQGSTGLAVVKQWQENREARRRMVDTEVKRMAQLRTALPADEARGMLGILLGIITRNAMAMLPQPLRGQYLKAVSSEIVVLAGGAAPSDHVTSQGTEVHTRLPMEEA